VLGIDPGSRYTGWAVILSSGGRFQLAAGGVITTDPEAAMASRMWQILTGLRSVIAQHLPDVAAIEQIFSHRSAQSALVLGQARGVALAALAEGNLLVHEYNASTIKHSVGGSGKADKDQVARMVQMLLGEDLEGRADMRDACAIAMTHHLHAGRVNALGSVPTRSLPRVRKLDPRSPGAWGVTVDAKGRAIPVAAGGKR
jgi:crossover junction endodeoxyribonuclease RuvC